MIVSEKFIRSLVAKNGKYVIFTVRIHSIIKSCNVLSLKKYLQSPF